MKSRIPAGLKYAVFDLDNTLVEGRVASYIGKSYFFRELFGLRIGHLYKGWKGMKSVKEILKEGGEDAEARGMEAFMGVLGETRIATWDSIYDYAKKAVEKHELPGAKEFVGKCKNNGLQTYIATLGLLISAQAARDYFGADAARGNSLIAENGIIRGVKLTMKTGEDRLREVRTIANVNEALVVGNDRLDWPLMDAAGFSVAAPLADEETKKRADITITDFRELEFEPRKV
ncbi:MAG: haloacid dehalogenase-like hydrolase [Candidatus Aenigmarchaeota archaeon]|nr:haloacid dehalogenase-like hydrolase [Candidatus Aenigmarchaeota archaeon]